jgi:hypothetical protein
MKQKALNFFYLFFVFHLDISKTLSEHEKNNNTVNIDTRNNIIRSTNITCLIESRKVYEDIIKKLDLSFQNITNEDIENPVCSLEGITLLDLTHNMISELNMNFYSEGLRGPRVFINFEIIFL